MIYVIRSAKTPAEISKKIPSGLKKRHSLLLNGRPCVVYDQNTPPPWTVEDVVDLPLFNEILTFPVAFQCHVDTPTKFYKALADFIVTCHDDEASSDEEDTHVTNSVSATGDDGDTYANQEADMEEDMVEEDESSDDD